MTAPGGRCRPRVRIPETQRQARGQGRRGTRQNTARESVQEQEDSGVQPEQEAVEQESGQEQDSGMVMSM